VLNVESGAIQTITSDRYNSVNPVWSRTASGSTSSPTAILKTTIGGSRGDRASPSRTSIARVKIYELALTPGLRSPFLPPDELHPESKQEGRRKAADDKEKDAKSNSRGQKACRRRQDPMRQKKEDKKKKTRDKKKPAEVKIDFTDLAARLDEVPAPPGNYGSLQATDKRLCWLNASDDAGSIRRCNASTSPTRATNRHRALDVKGYEISLDRKKMLVSKGDDFYIFDFRCERPALGDPKAMARPDQSVALDHDHQPARRVSRHLSRCVAAGARLLLRPQHAWRGLDAMRDRYLPLVDRVADRDELNNVIAQMVSEFSALHTFVQGRRCAQAGRQCRHCHAGRGSAPR
jgi:tricorn protease